MRVPGGGPYLVQESADYREFGYLVQNAAELELNPEAVPEVRRVGMRLADGRHVSALLWRRGDPELVLLHGGGQNAHTWDSFNLLVKHPTVAIDLPGHGHSDWRDDGDYSPWANADAIAEVVGAAGLTSTTVVAGALGGLTAIALAATRPNLVSRLVIVDVTPGVSRRTQSARDRELETTALTRGPRRYDSFQQMVEAAVASSPRRAPEAIARGVRHNARQLGDGSWAWRYDRLDGTTRTRSLDALWSDVERITSPTMLVVGSRSAFVGQEDIEQMERLLPGLRVEKIDGAGHNVHSERPQELASLVEGFSPAAGASPELPRRVRHQES